MQNKQPPLTVFFDAMPESNGKRNWTVILCRVEGRNGTNVTGGMSFERTEYYDRALSYDDVPAVAQAKHTLFEIQSALGERLLKVIHTADMGLMVMNANLRTRKMTFTEKLVFHVFGTVPNKL